MTTRRKRILIVSVVAVLGVCWVCRHHHQGPKFHGRTLEQWLAGHGPYQALTAEDKEAIRALGTNSLPELARRVSCDTDLCWQQRLLDNLPTRVTHGRLQRFLDNQRREREQEAIDATEAFQILGSQAAPAIPQLIRAATSGPTFQASRAVDCLACIGQEALPALIMVATNSHFAGRDAVSYLAAFTNSPEAMRIVAEYEFVGTPKNPMRTPGAAITTTTNAPAL
jgi:hypothetical protein